MPGRAPAHAQLDQIATTLNNASHHLNVCTPQHDLRNAGQRAGGVVRGGVACRWGARGLLRTEPDVRWRRT